MKNQKKYITVIFFFSLFIFVAWQLIQIFLPFLNAFFWAAIIAFAFYPIHRFIQRPLLKHPSWAAFFTTTSIALIIMPPVWLILKSILRQTFQVYRLTYLYTSQGNIERLVLKIKSMVLFQSLQNVINRSEFLVENLPDILLKTTQTTANFITSRLAAVTRNIFSISFDTLLTIIFLYFLLRYGEKIYHLIYELIPMAEKDRKALSARVNDSFSAVIRGQFVTSIVQAVLAGITFAFLGFRASSFMGLAVFFASMIPLTGSSTVWVPVMIYLFATQQVVKGVILFFVGFFVISLSDNFLKPILIGGKTKIPAFIIFLGIFGGLTVYGLTGIFLGPAIIALFFALVKIYHERYLD